MAVVAFSCLVVVADNPLVLAPVKQRVFQSMPPLVGLMRQLPNPDLDDGAIRQIEPSVLQQGGERLHMTLLAYVLDVINSRENHHSLVFVLPFLLCSDRVES